MLLHAFYRYICANPLPEMKKLPLLFAAFLVVSASGLRAGEPSDIHTLLRRLDGLLDRREEFLLRHEARPVSYTHLPGFEIRLVDSGGGVRTVRRMADHPPSGAAYAGPCGGVGLSSPARVGGLSKFWKVIERLIWKKS